MAIYRFDQSTPDIDPSAWVAEDARVIGDVRLGADASVWFGAILRGDTARLSVGRGSNIQDGSVVHADPGRPTAIGEDVTVGHMAMLHGCTVGDGSLVGIGGVILNGAVIGRHCLVGARALVTEGKSFPDGSLIVGAPATVARLLTPEQIEGLMASARHYVENAKRFRVGLARIA